MTKRSLMLSDLCLVRPRQISVEINEGSRSLIRRTSVSAAGNGEYQPRGVTDGPEDAAVTEDDDGERDEEDKGEEQHGVRADR